MTGVAPTTGSARMGAGKIILLLLGAFAAVVGLATMVGGGVLVWAHATQRDPAGFYSTSTERFVTSTYALTSDVDLGRAPGAHDWMIAHTVGTVRVRAIGHDQQPIFIGIAPKDAVDQWLTGVAHEHVTSANFQSFRTNLSMAPGSNAPALPLTEHFWAASTSGSGTQTLLWPSKAGHWTIVVMRADATPGLTADVDVGAKTGILLPVGLGLGAFALVALVGAGLMIFLALRHQIPASEPLRSGAPVPAGTYPARLDGHLAPDLSRWLWLVKWLLLIPHVIVLAFLWLAVMVLTVIAGFAILLTGQYPRSIFNFNVGVMRWTWRVSFYGISALATDRYPPFTLRSVPGYRADFTVDYPEHLSRGLVLNEPLVLPGVGLCGPDA